MMLFLLMSKKLENDMIATLCGSIINSDELIVKIN